MTNAERFMQRYMEVWPTFDADRLEAAMDPEATIHHSGMPAPIRGAEEPDYVRGIKALMPDVSLRVANWAANDDDVVFIENQTAAPSSTSRSAGPASAASSSAASTRSTPSAAGTTSSSSPRSTPLSAQPLSPKPRPS